MKSVDRGLNWSDLGVILDAAPPDVCDPIGNYAFLGGVGDPTMIRSRDGAFMYFIAANYAGGTPTDKANQGLLLARMAWTDRDSPVGKVYWYNAQSGAWDLPVLDTTGAFATSAPDFVQKVRPIPIFDNARSWRAPQPDTGDYGTYTEASIHGNTYLDKYVMIATRFHERVLRSLPRRRAVHGIRERGRFPQQPGRGGAVACLRRPEPQHRRAVPRASVRSRRP
jgi:hypothetical protein